MNVRVILEIVATYFLQIRKVLLSLETVHLLLEEVLFYVVDTFNFHIITVLFERQLLSPCVQRVEPDILISIHGPYPCSFPDF